ncbi:MAG: hypothetical protein PVF75_05430 [Granulosicoccaceae bacterium]|jgi:hypothetical protein
MKTQSKGWPGMLCWALLSGALFLSSAHAQEPETNTISPGQANVVDKISADYSDFLGEQTEVVVTGLRNGSEITLPADTGTTSFTPPTGKMGYGNVSISLGLAQEQLAQYGITQPTAEELQASLVGGEISTASGGTAQLDGVLTLRSQGMGWGEIAHEYGVKLGHVISTVKSGRPHVLTETGTATSGQQHKGAGKGTISATGAGDASTSNHGKGYAYGKGIVTGSGASSDASDVSGAEKSSGTQGNAYGHGIVSGGGAPVTPGSIDGGKGNAYGHDKGRIR